jgi:hypothetical protein
MRSSKVIWRWRTAGEPEFREIGREGPTMAVTMLRQKFEKC